MFERFTAEARQTVVEAKAQAEIFGHARVGTEHLLSALVATSGIPAEVLGGAGITRAVLDEALSFDRAALDYLGIDLDQVLARTRAMFPEHPCRNQLRGVRFAAETKKALELSLREAIRLGHRHIGAEHILLGLIRSADNRACRLLIERGSSLAVIRSRVEERLRSAS
jgi:ATP-dependent Clp protease ATP-binding subunit ClpA